MAQKTLQMGVVLFGRVDNTFGQIGQSLIQLGSQVDQISQKLIDFGKESIQVYRDYEDSMLDAEGALATVYGRDSTALKRVMKELNALATETAATTIFHTNDVANAINEAAHANWNLETILSGIPAAVKLAQAGGFDLSTAMDYMITSVNAGNIELENMSHWIDIWAYAANSSAGTVSEFGEAFERMGKMMTFAGSGEELLTMLAVLHDSGTKGAQAGTLLRNTMIRLIAPTEKASDVMAALEISEADMSEAISECNGDLDAAAKSLKEAGFSAYDSKGELKDFIEIFGDLKKALDGMSEEERNNVLAAIFPTRSLPGALAILDEMTGKVQELYDKLMGGEAEGYGGFLAELQTSGVTGDIEILLSKWENLEKRVGEFLAPDVRSVTEALGGMLDKIDAMDDAKFNAIAGAMKGLALAGPGMMLTGLALKGIGALLTPTGLIATGAVALIELNSAMKELNEAKFNEKFGTGDLDTESLNAYITQIGEDFDAAQAKITGFKTAVDSAVTSYTEASSAFTSDILTAVLTNQTFTEPEKKQLQQMGVDIFNYVRDGIMAANDASAEYWSMIYGGEEINADDPRFKEIIALLNTSQEEMLEDAARINENINDLLMKGFKEGFDETDYALMLEYFRQYNEMVADAAAEAQREEDFVQQQMWLHKAETASLDEIEDMAISVTKERDQMLAELDRQFYEEQFRLQYRGADQATLDANKAEYEGYRIQAETAYDDFLTKLWGTQIKQADLSGSYAQLMNYADLFLSGALSGENINDLLRLEFGKSKYAGDERGSLAKATTREQLGQYLGMMVESLGGVEEVAKKIDYYQSNGQTQMAENLRSILAAEQLVNNFKRTVWDSEGNFLTAFGAMDEFRTASTADDIAANKAMMDALVGTFNNESARAAIDMLGESVQPYFEALTSGAYITDLENAWDALREPEREAIRGIVNQLGQVYDFERVNAGDNAEYAKPGNADFDVYAAWKLMNMSAFEANPYRLRPQTDPEVAAQLADELGPVDVEVGFPNAVSTAQSTHAQMASAFTPITQDVVIRQIGSANPNRPPLPAKAKGGRETVPSIFAEAGIPEWYIPEEHTDNTANLILGAAYGSGFDIFDLAEYAGANLFAEGGVSGGGDVSLPVLDWGSLSTDSGAGSDSGGGSGSGGGSTIQIEYSPIVHADNAEGVEKALKADKARFEKWINEWWEKKLLYERIVMYDESMVKYV